jgi:ribonuclease-3
MLAFEEVIKYEFEDKNLLLEALTHSSYANENPEEEINFNERLEFLGDSVLGIIISDFLFKNYPNLPEGKLTKIRAKIVCEASLAEASREIELGEFLRLGNGEELTGGRNRPSILADGFEALLAAIYLDSDLEAVERFIFRTMNHIIENSIKGKILLDYKTHLQEVVQANTCEKLDYEIYEEKGPDHNKTFYVAAKLNERILGRGRGNSKKEAEQNAAKYALERVNFNE